MCLSGALFDVHMMCICLTCSPKLCFTLKAECFAPNFMFHHHNSSLFFLTSFYSNISMSDYNDFGVCTEIYMQNVCMCIQLFFCVPLPLQTFNANDMSYGNSLWKTWNKKIPLLHSQSQIRKKNKTTEKMKLLKKMYKSRRGNKMVLNGNFDMFVLYFVPSVCFMCLIFSIGFGGIVKNPF